MGLFFRANKGKQDNEFEKWLSENGFVISKKVFQIPSIYVDIEHKKFALSDNKKIYKFSDLIDYGNEQKTSIISSKEKGSTGKAIVGGLAFGVTGAVIGANMKKAPVQRSVTMAETHITLNDPQHSRITFHYYQGAMFDNDGKRVPLLQQKIDEVEGTFGFIKANSDLDSEKMTFRFIKNKKSAHFRYQQK
jgi:hypothetical protein